MNIEGLKIDSRIIAVFQVFDTQSRLPFANFKIKVVERPIADGRFLAIPNVAIRATNDSPDWIAGLGNTIDEAVENALRCFYETWKNRQPLVDADFEWADPHDF